MEDNYQEEIKSLAFHINEILKILGENPQREGLIKTPERSAKALLSITRGYKEQLGEIIGDAIFDSKSNDMIIVRNIEFYSLCEHHLLPFYGHISIGYIPDGKIIGLSKLARIVDMYSKRLQVQERLTNEICEALTEAFPNKGFIVLSEAHHLCMKMRGVEKQDSMTVAVASSRLYETSLNLKDYFFENLQRFRN